MGATLPLEREIRRLDVFYDARCELCRTCGGWLNTLPTYFPVTFHNRHNPQVRERFLDMELWLESGELAVRSDMGAVIMGRRRF